MPSGWELLQEVFTVETIMTPWNDVAVFNDGELMADSLEIAMQYRYNLLPVVSKGKVTGLLSARKLELIELTPDWLVTRDTSIPDLIDLFAPDPLRGFIVVYSQSPVGFVTPADINKLPTRIYLYNLIAELETKLAAAIHTHFAGDQEAIIAVLGKTDTTGEFELLNPDMQTAGVDVGILQLSYLSDLVHALRRTPELYQAIGFNSSNEVKKTLGGVVDLRNQVGHPVRPILRSGLEVELLSKRINQIREVLPMLENFLNGYTSPDGSATPPCTL